MLHGRHDRKIDHVVLRVQQKNCQQFSTRRRSEHRDP